MTDASGSMGAPAADTQLEARILHLILKGQLRDTSSIADGDDEPCLLADHPRFSKVLRLANVARSLELLEDSARFEEREPTWSSHLGNRPIAQVLFETSRQHHTGFLTVEDGERRKVVAFAAGAAACIGSNLPHEQLGEVLISAGLTARDALERARRRSEAAERPLEWGLLAEQLVSVDALLDTEERQARGRIFDLFDWKHGELRFFLDSRAAQLDAVINLTLMPLLRTGTWTRRTGGVDELRAACAPVLDPGVPLELLRPVGTLQFGLTDAESLVLGAARSGAEPAALLTDLATLGPEAVLEGLRLLYLFVQIGVIGLHVPDHAQPVLDDLEQDEGALVDFGHGVRLPSILGPVDATFNVVRGPPTGEVRPLSTGNQLSEYRLQLRLEGEAKQLLHQHRYDDAIGKLRELIARQERPVQAYSYLAVALLLARVPNAKNRAYDYANRALEMARDDPLARAAMSRILEARNNHGWRVNERLALEYAEHNEDWYEEVKALLEVGKESVAERNAAEARANIFTVTLTLLTLVILFVVANLLGHGEREYYYDGADWFFYVRRGGLLVLGILGIRYGGRVPWSEIVATLGWGAPWRWLGLGLAYGAVVGLVSPPQRVTGTWEIVAALTAFHVVAEEVFFRGFVSRVVVDRTADIRQAMLVSGGIYGAYHLTYYSFWHETGFIPTVYWCTLIGTFAGIPYALLYQRSRSILVPLVCHGSVSGVMMAMSLR